MKYAQNADVLLHEVFIDGEFKETNKMRTKKTLHNVRDYHTPSTLLGKIAKLSQPKKLILSHILFWGNTESSIINEVRQNYDGEVIIAEDLMVVD